MKKLVKLFIISLLSAICVLGLVACGSDSESSAAQGIICKKIDGDAFYTVVGYNAEEGVTTLDISEKVKAKYGDTAVVGRIRAGAFDGNTSLTEIIVKDSAEDDVNLTIDEGAFKNMRALKKITLPFVGANARSDAYFNASAPHADKAVDKARSFGYIFGEEESDFSSPITFTYGENGTATFYIPVALTQVVISADYDIVIPMYAFCGLTRVYSVKLNGKITAIGEKAFSNMPHLSSVNIPASVETIYDYAFENTPFLKGALEIAENSQLKEIKEGAFKGTKLTSVDVSGTQVSAIGNYAFYGSALVSFKFNLGINSVGAYAFANSKNLSLLNVVNKPADEKLGVNAFADIKED